MKACLRCNYALDGLPQEHACPECGLRYGAGDAVWRDRRPRRIWFVALGVFALYVLTFYALDARFGSGSAPWVRHLLMALGLTVFLLLAPSPSSLPTLRRGRFIALTADGIVARLSSPTVRLLPWDGMVDFYVDALGKLATAEYADDFVPLHISGLFADGHELRAFEAAVRARIGVSESSESRRPADKP